MLHSRLGVIGGSGLYDLPGLKDPQMHQIDTPFGSPSDELRSGHLGTTEIVFLSRHGAGHRYSPSTIPYQANIYALKQLGVTHILSISAVGSLRDDLPPRSIVIPDQIIDRTVRQDRTFFDRGIVAHVGLAEPYCPVFRDALLKVAPEETTSVRNGGTYVCIEGPQFSTRAESHLYRTWGATIIGMTSMPEARLAREAELCYATLALVTDYDVWHDSEESVTVGVVLGHLQHNLKASQTLLTGLTNAGLPARQCSCASSLDGAIMTTAEMSATSAERSRLGIIGDRVLVDSQRTTD